jgi:hypothetical protein
MTQRPKLEEPGHYEPPVPVGGGWGGGRLTAPAARRNLSSSGVSGQLVQRPRRHGRSETAWMCAT